MRWRAVLQRHGAVVLSGDELLLPANVVHPGDVVPSSRHSSSDWSKDHIAFLKVPARRQLVVGHEVHIAGKLDLVVAGQGLLGVWSFSGLLGSFRTIGLRPFDQKGLLSLKPRSLLSKSTCGSRTLIGVGGTSGSSASVGAALLLVTRVAHLKVLKVRALKLSLVEVIVPLELCQVGHHPLVPLVRRHHRDQNPLGLLLRRARTCGLHPHRRLWYQSKGSEVLGRHEDFSTHLESEMFWIRSPTADAGRPLRLEEVYRYLSRRFRNVEAPSRHVVDSSPHSSIITGLPLIWR